MSVVFSSISIEASLFVATTVFSSLTFLSLFDQIRRIRAKHSIESIDSKRNLVSCFIYLAGFIYGTQQEDLALVINSFIIVPTIVVQCYIYKYVSCKSAELKIALLLLILDLAIVSVSFGGTLYLLILCFGYVGALSQVRVLYSSKSAGALSPYVFITAILSSITWLIYAYLANGGILKITTPVSFLLNSSMFLLWLKYTFKPKNLSWNLRPIVHFYVTLLTSFKKSRLD